MVLDSENPSIGVEEEFQIVSLENTSLTSGYDLITKSLREEISSRIRRETYNCFLECATDVCHHIDDVFGQTMSLRATVAKLAQQNNMAIISTATHPKDTWFEQQMPSIKRYEELVSVLQYAVCSRLICGLHIHVGFQDEDLRIQIMNQVRSYLPHLLALSANSPCWMGQFTGWMAYRAMTWHPAPWVGIPDPFANVGEYRRYRNLLFNSDTVGHAFNLWWDIRPHEVYPTLEFRIADMPLYHRDMVAIVALVQSLVKKLLWLNKRGQCLPVLPASLINENKWRAARWGLRGIFRDWHHECEVATVDALYEMLVFVREVEDELGTRTYLAHIQSMLEPDYLSGAELQIKTFEQHQSMDAVTRMLIRETLRGIDMNTAIV